MSKFISKVSLFFLSLIVFPCANAYDFNQQSINNLASVYGYIYAQNYSLERITLKYPDLRSDVFLAKTRFNSKFPNIQDKSKELLLSFNYQKINPIILDIESNYQKSFSDSSLTRSEAIKFIDEVNHRAKGNIISPSLENILSVQYDENPVNEIFDGFYQSYSSAGNPKSKGITVNLRLPKSWKRKEPYQPNIVDKWISQNGTDGKNSINLMVKDLELSDQNFNVTRQDIQDMYNNGEIYEIATEAGFRVIDSGSHIVLAGQNGFHMTMAGTTQQVDIDLYTIMDMYTIFYNGKLISVQCGSVGLSKDKYKIDKEFSKYKLLCRTVANSLTLPQRFS